MEFNFNGKTALVTGAGKGIGRGIAAALWASGATVYALSRTQSDLDSLKEECPGMQTILADLQNWSETRNLIEGLSDVDLLVNNAGVYRPSSILETAEEDFAALVDVNLKAVVYVTQVIARGMISRRTGAIVNIGSASSLCYFEGLYVVGALKAALDQLTRFQAVELGRHEIRVNCVSPTMVMTEMVAKFIAENQSGPVERNIQRMPISRAAEVKDVVNATLYLLSVKAQMITGVILPVDGGLVCA